MKKILIVVDVQNDFIDGALRNEEAIKRVPNIVEEIKNFDGDCIICTYDTHHENYLETMEGKRLPVPHCIKGTNGWEYNKEIDDVLHNNKALKIVISKKTFGYDNWKEVFKDVKKKFSYKEDSELEIEVLGFCTDICVISNTLAIKATVPNARIVVKESCCAGVTPERHQNALEAMKCCHIDII